MTYRGGCFSVPPMNEEMSKNTNEDMNEEMSKDQTMTPQRAAINHQIDKLHAAGLPQELDATEAMLQDLDNAALETRRLRVENEELTEKLWAAEKALNDAVLNLQRLRDKLNAERSKCSHAQGKAFMGDLREWHGEF